MAIYSSKTKSATWRRWVSDGIAAANALITTIHTLVGAGGSVGLLQEVVFTAKVVATNTINTSERAEDNMSLTIPSHWVTFDLQTTFTCTLDEVAAADNAQITIMLRKGTDTTSGTEIARNRGRMSHNASTGATEMPLTITGWEQGATETGTYPLTLTAEASGQDEDYRILFGQWTMTARRVT